MLRRRVMRLLGERWSHRAFSKVLGRGRFWMVGSKSRQEALRELSKEGTESVEG